MKHTLLALGACLLAATASADGFMPWNDVARMYDDNNDGRVSQLEVEAVTPVLGRSFVGFQPWFRDHFAELDGDHDGQVSMTEMKTWMAAHQMSDADMSKGFYRGFGFMPNNQL